MTTTINERARHLLKILIERYIREGQPVGSKILANESALDLSPATVRNVMSELEELGYLQSPHTSAGRIPTPLAYRFFVDSLVTVKPMDAQDIELLREEFQEKQSVNELVRSASGVLSSVTQLAGVVSLPRTPRQILRHIEFLPLQEQRVLVILVLNDSEVQNRVIQLTRPYSASELQEVANYLMAQYSGEDLSSLRKSLVTAMQSDRDRMEKIAATALEVADEVLSMESSQEDYILAGQNNLLDESNLTEIDNLRQLFEAFGEKQRILHLLDQCLSVDGIQIFIGENSSYALPEEYSVVTRSYQSDGKPAGVLGVIGPTRMAYDRIIPMVDITARLLSAALSQDKTLEPQD